MKALFFRLASSLIPLAAIGSASALAAETIEFRGQYFSPSFEHLSGIQLSIVPGAYHAVIRGEARDCRIVLASLGDVREIRELMSQAKTVVCAKMSQDPNVFVDQLWMDLGQ